jgi:hypothetical protein
MDFWPLDVLLHYQTGRAVGSIVSRHSPFTDLVVGELLVILMQPLHGYCRLPVDVYLEYTSSIVELAFSMVD